MTMTPNQHTSSNLRKQIRKQRLALSPHYRRLASQRASRQLWRWSRGYRLPKNCKIAIFVDAFGEIPTQPIVDWALSYGFLVYLPVVTQSYRPLTFIQLTAKKLNNTRFIRHSLGMKQPAKGKRLSVNQLDLMFLPLVALDKNGQRLGMGGGFYDKTLEKSKQKPIKIGWAYDFQLVNHLTTNVWDIGLDMAVLPSGWLRF